MCTFCERQVHTKECTEHLSFPSHQARRLQVKDVFLFLNLCFKISGLMVPSAQEKLQDGNIFHVMRYMTRSIFPDFHFSCSFIFQDGTQEDTWKIQIT